MTTFLVNNANIFWSPGTWEFNGSTWAQTNTFGNYFKTKFTGTACQIEIGAISGGVTESYLAYSVDGGAITTSASFSQAAGASIIVATGLSDTLHTLKVWLKGSAYAAQWTSPVAVTLQVTGITVTGAAPALSAPTLLTGRGIVFGDSITNGDNVNGGGYLATQIDSTNTYAQQVALGLNAEVGIVGFPGQGYGRVGINGTPEFHIAGSSTQQTWQWLRDGVARSFTGIDWILVNEGHNDGMTGTPDATVQASVTDFLTLARAALPAGAKIYLMVPFNGILPTGYKRTPITAGFTNYKAATPDANAQLVDIWQRGNLTAAQIDSPDQEHPTQAGHDQLARFLIDAMSGPRRLARIMAPQQRMLA